MKERSVGKSFTQIGQRRSISKLVFLPRDLLLELVIELCGLLRLLPFADARRLVLFRVAAYRKEHHQVPMIALAVAHP